MYNHYGHGSGIIISILNTMLEIYSVAASVGVMPSNTLLTLLSVVIFVGILLGIMSAIHAVAVLVSSSLLLLPLGGTDSVPHAGCR